MPFDAWSYETPRLFGGIAEIAAEIGEQRRAVILSREGDPPRQRRTQQLPLPAPSTAAGREPAAATEVLPLFEEVPADRKHDCPRHPIVHAVPFE